MIELPVLTEFTDKNLTDLLKHFSGIQQITSENRSNFSGEFPTHTRYFSNGDRPLVALIKYSSKAILQYENKDIKIPDLFFVFFDDSVAHSWVFSICNLDIYYYRYINKEAPVSRTEDYCLDNYF